MYNNELLSDLIETAIQKEVRRFLKQSDIDWVRLAESHAIKMLEEIEAVLDKPLSLEDKYDRIMKIVAFFRVKPHID